jgi:hypothetical protein
MQFKKITGHFIKAIIVEVFIIFCLIFLINNYFKNETVTIKADGIGYYDYLPSIFIHHDLIRKDIVNQHDQCFYKRIDLLSVYLDYDGHKVNKYPCGTSILELPFFASTILTTHLEGNDNDGYQLPFQISIFHAAIFYLSLSIFFLKKILELYDIRRSIIIFSQVIFVFATSVTNYVSFDAAFSHIYSLFAITAFIYFIKLYFTRRNINHFILACLFFGLILLIRQINVIILLFVPFLAGSKENLKEGVHNLFKHPVKLLSGVFLVFGLFFIQCLLWYLQTGHFFIYSYTGETFDFLHPRMFKILFSYKKGLFIYTPILFITLSGIIYLALKRKFYLVSTWLAFFLVVTYLLSSWWSWSYGSSYGMRAFIDFYSLFFIPFAIMLNGVHLWTQTIVIFLSFLTIPVNIIQTYQYKNFILNWGDMDKDKYWKVFLRTDDRFKGLVWKRNYDFTQYKTLKEIIIGDLFIPGNRFNIIRKISSKEIPGFQDLNILQILINNDFKVNNDARIIFDIIDSSGNNNSNWFERYLIQFTENGFNRWQTGVYNFEIPPIKDQKDKFIDFAVYSKNYEGKLTDVRLRFLKHI